MTVGEPVLLERPRRSFYERHEAAILGGLSVLVALAAWQWAWSSGRISPLFFTGPSQFTAPTGNIAAAVTPRTKLIYAETPTNPMMRLCDLKATGEIARRAKQMTPPELEYSQQRLEWLADEVWRVATGGAPPE